MPCDAARVCVLVFRLLTEKLWFRSLVLLNLASGPLTPTEPEVQMDRLNASAFSEPLLCVVPELTAQALA